MPGSPRQDWHSTYSDIGKWHVSPFPAGGVAATGVYVPGSAHGRERDKRKVGLTKKAAAMNKSGKHRRAEMADASPPPRPVKHDVRGELATPMRDAKGKVRPAQGCERFFSARDKRIAADRLARPACRR
jgi:hypothetical protein